MNKNKFEIDRLTIKIDVNHKPEKVSSCLQIYSDKEHSFESSNISYQAKKIISKFDSVITVQSCCTKETSNTSLKLTGNLYKFLYGHNVTGSQNLIDLILQVVDQLKEMNLIQPTEEQLENIRFGRFRIFNIDIKRDLIFNSKQNALEYLNHLKKYATYSYKEKTIFENGIYFGLCSKRWHICNYYKGRELEVNSKKTKTSAELKALADLMIRQEIRIQSKQLATWDLRFGYQWLDLNNIENFFNKILEKIYIPEIILKDSKNNICDKSDRKFYNCVINGDHKEVYSRATISRKRRIFLDKYNIDINNI